MIDNNPLYCDMTVNYNSVESLPMAGLPDDFKEVETNHRTDNFENDGDISDDEKPYDRHTEVSSCFVSTDKQLQEVDAIDMQLSNMLGSVCWPSVENEPLNEYSLHFMHLWHFQLYFPTAKVIQLIHQFIEMYHLPRK